MRAPSRPACCRNSNCQVRAASEAFSPRQIDSIDTHFIVNLHPRGDQIFQSLGIPDFVFRRSPPFVLPRVVFRVSNRFLNFRSCGDYFSIV
jgi:hypothetical protein